MADLPERRIDDCQARSDQLPLVKIGDQAEQAVAELAHGCDQLAHVHSGEEIGSCAGDRRLHLGICRENSWPIQLTKNLFYFSNAYLRASQT